ncbi:hypothetical protein CSC94_20625 [Zhengella mangrovi]|uniref:Serine aminopeptidase S33 domain-containing protein n=1 Tax=Zhengella mangrovi TaxID=1982044 RepID=A0A2G1QHV7_9HYPH|nr:alpha/beta fold hydrolase [Zhengella mangrovi]PHP65127.1 hypothetical protein CSC94_20625 [Zhengella mangrovi]
MQHERPVVRPAGGPSVDQPGLAEPVAFDSIAGWFHPACGKTAVLLASPWGYEELCSRKSFRLLGEKLAAAGISCLRFDYPGSGHSLGDAAAIADDHAWRKATRRALAELRALCRPDRVILAGQGIGAAFAADLAGESGVDGLILMAPVTKGRSYLRELAAWTAMTRPTFRVETTDGPQGGLMAGGFCLSAATVGEWRGLTLDGSGPEGPVRTLLVARPDHPGDAAIAEAFAAAGHPADRLTFEGYADYTKDPTLSVVPEKTLNAIVTWCGDHFPSSITMPAVRPVPEGRAINRSTDFTEELLRFGDGRMFFGVLAQPRGPASRTAVVFLNSGYDHAIGWGRMTTGFARALAGDGYVSLRYDGAGIGESRYWPGQQGQVLYGARQADDVRAALDRLFASAEVDRAVLFGRCSGAYLALLAAASDDRVGGAVLVNPRRLVWNPAEDVETAIREPLQTLATYRRKMTDAKMIKRVLSGEVSPAVAARKLFRAVHKVADRKFAPVLRGLSGHYRLTRVADTRLKALEKRGAPVQFLYSAGDPGLPDLAARFGDDYRGLSRYSNVELAFIEDADHNVTPLPARAEVYAVLRRLLIRATAGR